MHPRCGAQEKGGHIEFGVVGLWLGCRIHDQTHRGFKSLSVRADTLDRHPCNPLVAAPVEARHIVDK